MSYQDASYMSPSEKTCPFCTIAPDQIILERPLALVKRDGYWRVSKR